MITQNCPECKTENYPKNHKIKISKDFSENIKEINSYNPKNNHEIFLSVSCSACRTGDTIPLKEERHIGCTECGCIMGNYIRHKIVGETVEMKLECKSCGKNKVKIIFIEKPTGNFVQRFLS